MSQEDQQLQRVNEPQRGPNVFRVGGIGKQTPVSESNPNVTSEAMAYLRSNQLGTVITADKFPDAPSWVLELSNQVELLRQKVLALEVALIQTRVLRTHEITEAMMMMQSVAEEQLRAILNQLNRQVAQRPVVPASKDPRRAS